MPLALLPFRFRWIFVVICLGGLTAQAAVTIDDVVVGFGGRYKLGTWMPVTVTISSDEKTSVRMGISAADGEGVECEFDSDAVIALDPNQPTRVQHFIRIGRVGGHLAIAVYQDDQPTLRQVVGLPRKSAIASTDHFGLVFGSAIDSENAAKLQRGAQDNGPMAMTRTQDARVLPHHWFGYDTLDVVVIPTGSPELLETITDTQWDALERWLVNGGNLIVSVGSGGDELLGGEHPLSRFVPGTFAGVTRRQETTELESYSKKTRVRLDLVWRDVKDRSLRGVLVTKIADPTGYVAAADGSASRRVPWVIRQAYGFGTLTFVACDLDTGPIAEWEGRPRFVARLLDDTLLGQSRVPDRSDDSNQVTHLGFDDLSGQLRAALDRYPGVRLVPFSVIAAAAGLYVLLIGPGDYFLLRRIAPRMEWTWLTFPLTIVTVTGLAIALAVSWKGTDPRANFVAVLDVDTARGSVRCTNLAHVYPVAADRYDIEFEAEVCQTPEHLVSWMGLPGTGLGGMRDRVSAAQFSDSYQIEQTSQSASTKIVGLPIPRWASRSVTCLWSGQLPTQNLAADAQPLQITRFDRLSGVIRNCLPYTIRDAAIAYGGFYYQVGTLQPGQEFVLNSQVRSRDFRNRLTRRRFVGDKEIAHPWVKTNRDVPRIIELIMFHDRAGGFDYANLTNRHLSKLDLSDHLITNGAVLYGRLDDPVTTWSVEPADLDNDAVEDWTFCRLIFPVSNIRLKRTSPSGN